MVVYNFERLPLLILKKPRQTLILRTTMKKHERLVFLVSYRLSVTLLFITLHGPQLSAQTVMPEVYGLEDCISISSNKDNSLQLQQIKISLNALDIKSSNLGMYTPGITTSITESFNFSNSIDPLTFNFVAQNTNATIGSVDIAWDIFNGFQKQNAHRGLLTDRSVFELEKDLLLRETALLTAQSFFAVYASKVSLDLVDTALRQSMADLEQYDKLIGVGLQPAASRVEFEVSLVEQELQRIQATSQLERSKLSLSQLLQTNDGGNFLVDTSGILDIIGDTVKYLNYQGVEKTELLGELRLQAERHRYKSAKGFLWPTISIGARFNTNFFSASQQIEGFSGQDNFPIIGETLSGESVISAIPLTQPIYASRPFGNQLKTNFSQSANLTLSFPLWGRYQRLQVIQQQQLAQEQVALTNERELLEDQNRLASFVLEARASLETYKQTLRVFTINGKASEAAQKRYESGLISPYELALVRNRQQIARVQFYQARLDLASKLHMIRIFYDYSN